MLRHTGKAAAEIGRTVHRVCHFLLTVVIVLTAVIAVLAWRLAQGPVDLSFFKDHIQQAVSASIAPARVTIGSASIAWGGFSNGLDQPLLLRVTDLTVDEPGGAGVAHIPLAEAALSARWMVIGRILPRSIMLQGAHLLIIRNADGSFNFDIGNAGNNNSAAPWIRLAAVLGAPRATDLQAGGRRLSQLSEVSIHAADLSLDDRRMGMTWSANPADIDLFRHRGGGVDGRATLAVALGGQRVALTSAFHLAPAAQSAHFEVSIPQVTPKALAGSAAILAPLNAVDVPLSLRAEADLGPDLVPTQIRLAAQAGSGRVVTAAGSIPIHSAEFNAAGTLGQLTLQDAKVELQPAPNAAITTIGGSGMLTHDAGRLQATLHLALDHFSATDLPALWPADIVGNARSWIMQNVSAGIAHDGKADLVLASPDTTADVTLLSATGALEGDGIAVTWLPGLPAVEQTKAHLTLTDPDKIEIDLRGGRQLVRGADPIAVPYGHVTITGLAQKDQVATVQCEATGSIVSAIALLKEPRLQLLDRHPLDLQSPAGDARVSINAVVPLLRDLKLDDVALHGTANLSRAHLSGIIGGRDLDNGALLLDADTNHLSVKGTARLAGIQANLDGVMDFRAGPAGQALQHFHASGQATAGELTAAGLDTDGAVSGDVGLDVVLNEYRSGAGEVAVNADLTRSGLAVAPLAWRKPVGSAAVASARLVLAKDKLVGIDPVSLNGTGIQIAGAVSVDNGRLDKVRLDHAVLGRTDVRGTISLPPNGPITAELTGPALDAADKILQTTPRGTAPTPPGPAWSIRGRFDRVLLAHDIVADQVVASGDSDGSVLRSLAITGRFGAGKPFAIRIGPANGNDRMRRVTVVAADAGSILQALDITSEIRSGTLSISGEFDDTTPAHVLSGTLVIDEFRVSHAPALGKLLQAVTLYGLVDALGGPGLRFSRLTAPFQLDDDTLALHDARAFSSSLGLTVQGRIDRAADRLALSGTLVPAYVFNSMLGRIPLIGGLFSAEKGGGLFAMNYTLSGPIDNPSVTANPLSALTPGILRGMFGLFDRGAAENRLAPDLQTRLDRSAAGGNADAR